VVQTPLVALTVETQGGSDGSGLSINQNETMIARTIKTTTTQANIFSNFSSVIF
jgi:hypothetical protein